MTLCPCGSGLAFADCCQPILSGAPAPTAEALMRSRYSAFAVNNMDYLETSMASATRREFDKKDVSEWAKGVDWQGLDILRTEAGGEGDDTGVVEFTARFSVKGDDRALHETSRFVREDGMWKYLDGDTAKTGTVVRDAPKVGRNEPCPCGSGKKYKKCCGR
ncbi:MAG: YchJ family protein [Desulfovibrionaceae bacterium]